MEMLDPAQMKKALQAAQEYNAKTQSMRRGPRQPAPKQILAGAVTVQNVMRSKENQNAMAR